MSTDGRNSNGRSLFIVSAAAVVLMACGAADVPAQTAADAEAGQRDTTTSLSGGAGSHDELILTPEEEIRQINQRIAADPRNGSLYNDLGVIYAQQGEWFTAREAFISAIQTKPMEADFHRNLGLVLVELEDYDSAVREFDAYRRFDQLGNGDGPRLIGEAMARAGRWDEAIASWQGGLEGFGPSPGDEGFRLVILLADAHLHREHSAEARRLLEEYLPAAQEELKMAERDGRDAPLGPSLVEDRLMSVYVDDGRVLEDSGLPAEAAELYAKAFELAPQHGEILVRMIQQYLAAGDMMKAKVTARLARDDYPELSGAWMATGYIYEEEGHLDKAVEAYLKCREFESDNLDLDLRIGNLYMKLGDSAKARQYLAAGIESQTASPEVVYNYGVSLMREKRYGLAVTPLRKAVAMAPDMAPGWRALAQALRLANRHGEAVGAYEKAIGFGEDARLYFNLGSCQSKAGRVDGAVASYRRAIELDPTFESAYRNLSSTLFRAKRYSDAVEAYEMQLAVDSRKYTIYFNQGFSLYQLGRYDEALAKYELALEEKESADLFNNIGLVHDKLGDKEKARVYYNLAKEM